MDDLRDRPAGRDHRARGAAVRATGRLSRWFVVLGTCVAVAAGAPASHAGAAPAGPEPAAYLLADADTGVILAAKDERTPLPPASTVKVLTALVALEHLPVDATVPVSARAAAQPAMKIGMREGETWPLDDTLRSLLLASANDAAYAIAERVGGSVERFARIAQRSATRLGLRDTTFADPAGLDDDGAVGGGSRMSARDLAIVARNALTVPFIRETAALPGREFTDPAGAARRLPNHNATLLRGFAGANGLKTGYTRRAGRTLVATATRERRTMIAVVLGTWDTVGWARHLLEQGFATPVAAQAGARLPPVRFVSFEDRRAHLRAPAPVTAGSGRTRAAPAPTTAGAEPVNREATARVLSGLAATEEGAERGARPDTRLVALPLVLLALLVALRRRAVRRARARRARARALAEARRRRMIHVIDDGARVTAAVRVVPARSPSGRRSPSRVGHATPDR